MADDSDYMAPCREPDCVKYSHFVYDVEQPHIHSESVAKPSINEIKIQAIKDAADSLHQCTETGNIFGGLDCLCGENWAYSLNPLGCIQRSALHEYAESLEMNNPIQNGKD